MYLYGWKLIVRQLLRHQCFACSLYNALVSKHASAWSAQCSFYLIDSCSIRLSNLFVYERLHYTIALHNKQ